MSHGTVRCAMLESDLNSDLARRQRQPHRIYFKSHKNIPVLLAASAYAISHISQHDAHTDVKRGTKINIAKGESNTLGTSASCLSHHTPCRMCSVL